MNLQKKQGHRCKNLQLPSGKGGEGKIGRLELTYTLLFIKQVPSMNLLCSTGNSTQHSIMTCMGKESKEKWIYVYV